MFTISEGENENKDPRGWIFCDSWSSKGIQSLGLNTGNKRVEAESSSSWLSARSGPPSWALSRRPLGARGLAEARGAGRADGGARGGAGRNRATAPPRLPGGGRGAPRAGRATRRSMHCGSRQEAALRKVPARPDGPGGGARATRREGGRGAATRRGRMERVRGQRPGPPGRPPRGGRAPPAGARTPAAAL